MTDMGSAVFGGPEASIILLAALLVDAAVGVWVARGVPTPSEIAGRFVVVLERRLNRPERGPRDRLIRGLLVVLFLVGLAFLVGVGAREAARIGFGGGRLVDLVALVLCLRGRFEWSRVRAAGRILESRGAKAARPAFAELTRRPLDERDGHALVRVGVERLARSLDRRYVAPAFWFLLGGTPGLLLWSVVDGADAALGAPGVRNSAFGMTAARLDDALGALPARATALIIAAAAGFVGGASASASARVAWRDARLSPSFNMGWPIAATAGALGLSLCGPRREGAVVVSEAWLGNGRARASTSDLDRAAVLAAVAALILALIVVALMLGISA